VRVNGEVVKKPWIEILGPNRQVVDNVFLPFVGRNTVGMVGLTSSYESRSYGWVLAGRGGQKHQPLELEGFYYLKICTKSFGSGEPSQKVFGSPRGCVPVVLTKGKAATIDVELSAPGAPGGTPCW